MTRRMLICIFILACSFANAQLSPEVKPELVKTFKNSSNPGDIAVSIGGAYRPSGLGFAFDEAGKLYISEQASKRISVFSKDFSYEGPLKTERRLTYGTAFLSVKNNIISGQGWTHFMRYDMTKREVVIVEYLYNMLPGGSILEGGSFFIDNILVSYKTDSRDFGITCVINPTFDVEVNNRKIMNTEQTRELFRNRDPIIPKGLRIDEKDVLYYNDEVLTGNFDHYLDYWIEKYGDNYSFMPEHKGKFFVGGAMSFLGRDMRGNYYWAENYNEVMIFNKDGICQTVFNVPDDKSYTLPAFHPSGDMYFISYDKKNVYLWRVKKTW